MSSSMRCRSGLMGLSIWLMACSVVRSRHMPGSTTSQNTARSNSGHSYRASGLVRRPEADLSARLKRSLKTRIADIGMPAPIRSYFVSLILVGQQPMNDSNRRLLARVVLVLLVAVVLFSYGLVSGRFASLLATPFVLAVLAGPRWRSRRAVLTVTGLWLVASFSPVVVTLRDVPGPPHFVPYVIGTLTAEGREGEARGEFVSGGCIAFVFPPRWAWVW